MAANGRTAEEKERIKAERLARLNAFKENDWRGEWATAKVAETAQILNCSRQNVEKLIKEGALEFDAEEGYGNVDLATVRDYITGKGKSARRYCKRLNNIRKGKKILFSNQRNHPCTGRLVWRFDGMLQKPITAKKAYIYENCNLIFLARLIEQISRDAEHGFAWNYYENGDYWAIAIPMLSGDTDTPQPIGAYIEIHDKNTTRMAKPKHDKRKERAHDEAGHFK